MKKWGALITLSLAMFIIVIDTTIMNVSISALVEDLNTTVSGVQAAISIYALVMAAFILIGGKLSDIVGRKRIFVIGLIIYGVGTTVASFSQSLTGLIFGWSILEGLGGALMPFSLSLLVFAILGARMSARFYANRIIQVGFVLAIVGFGAVGASIKPGATPGDLVLGALFGAGLGLIASQILNLILSSVERKDTAETAGLSSTFEQLGNAIGVALVGTIMLGTLVSVMQQGIGDSAVIPSEAKATLTAAAEEGVQLMSDTQFESGLEEAGADPAISDELEVVYAESRTQAFKAGMALLVYGALLGLVVTLGLPKRKLVEAPT